MGLTLSFIFVHSLQLIEKAGFLFFDMLKDAISQLYLAERLVIEFVLAADENIELCCPGNRFFPALVLNQVHDAMTLEFFKSTRQIAYLPPGDSCKFLYRLGLFIIDQFKQILSKLSSSDIKPPPLLPGRFFP